MIDQYVLLRGSTDSELAPPVPRPSGAPRGPLTGAEVDAIVHRCRQAGDDSTYAVTKAIEEAHGVTGTPSVAEAGASDELLLKQALDAIEAQTADEWQGMNSYHPKIWKTLQALRARFKGGAQVAGPLPHVAVMSQALAALRASHFNACDCEGCALAEPAIDAIEQLLAGKPALYEKMRGGKPVTFWRDDALEKAAQIAEAYHSHPDVAAVIRALKSTSGVVAVNGPDPLSVGRALHAAAAAIYFTDSSDYLRALWTVVRELAPGIAEVLANNPRAAFDADMNLIAGGRVDRVEPPWWAAALNRRATVEQWMFDAARGKRPMPTAEELRAWALKLGTPAEGEPAAGMNATLGGQQ